MPGEQGNDGESRRKLTEAAVGITVLGVIANIGLTLWFGIHAAIGWRLLAAFAIPIAFVVVVAVGSRQFNAARTITRAVTSQGDDPWERNDDDGGAPT